MCPSYSSDLIGEAKDGYFYYLCGLVKLDSPDQNRNYVYLAKILHDMDFYWIIPHDDNREADGIDLRYQFIDMMESNNVYYPEDCLNGDPCSVLEMMVALAIRCENTIMCNPSRGDRSYIWFRHMINNLGLSRYDDMNINNRNFPDIHNKIEKFLERRYDFNGNGGLWPLKKTNYDQRNIEIWYQMCEYLKENYTNEV